MQGFGLGLAASAAAGITSGFVAADYGDLVVWLDATTGKTVDEDGVNLLADQSAYGNDATQTTGSKKPDVAAAYQNGLDAILFDGVDDALNFPDPIVAGVSDYTFFFAGKPTLQDHATNQYLFDTATGRLVFAHERHPDATAWYDGQFSDHGAPVVGAQILEFHLSAISPEAFRDGVSLGTGTYTQRAMSGLSKLMGHNTAGAYTIGYLFEMLIYAERLSLTFATTVRTYLDDKWSIF